MLCNIEKRKKKKGKKRKKKVGQLKQHGFFRSDSQNRRTSRSCSVGQGCSGFGHVDFSRSRTALNAKSSLFLRCRVDATWNREAPPSLPPCVTPKILPWAIWRAMLLWAWVRTFLLPLPGQKHLRTLSGGSQSYPKPSTGPRGIGVALVAVLSSLLTPLGSRRQPQHLF